MVRLVHSSCGGCGYPLTIEIDRPDQPKLATVTVYRRYRPPAPRQLASRCPDCGKSFRDLDAERVLRQVGESLSVQ